MLESMTGYGSATLHSPDLQVHAEFKTINHKFLELSVKLPQNYLQQEIVLRNDIAQRVKRGKGLLMVSVEHLNPETAGGKAQLNTQVLQGYYHDLTDLALSLGASTAIPITDLLTLPNAFVEGSVTVPEAEWQLVQQAVRQATDQLLENRRKEGAQLMQEFRNALLEVRERLAEIEPFEKARIEALRARMQNGLSEVSKNYAVNEERFQQELFYYMEKFDIAEEKARLLVHLDAFTATLDEPDSNGRKLNFLLQELWREVNTLGNKAYSTEIQRRVVSMKEELEKIKEQLNNIV
jgi:uncharacterized protein (TIGR00255 family)